MLPRATRLFLWLALAITIPACRDGGSATLTPTVAPSPPTRLAAKSGNGRVRLTWSASPAASSYVVRRSPFPGGPYSDLPASEGLTGTTFVDDGLGNGTTHHYVVAAVNRFGRSGDSAEVPGVAAFRAVSLAAGQHHSHAILEDGTVWSWGDNAQLTLGDGTVKPLSNVAVQVDLGGATRLTAGRTHVLALMDDGTVRAWGSNASGELGTGSTQDSSRPLAVAGLAGVLELAAGESFSVALLRDGSVRAWGKAQGPAGVDALAPLPVPGLGRIVHVAAGRDFAYAADADGELWAWGANGQGQLGIGSKVPAVVPSPVQVPNLTGVRSVAASDDHTLALRSDGSVWAWGTNFQGQLGDGSTGAGSLMPVQVPGLTTVVAVAVGWRSSLALRSDGTLVAWGYNEYGQMGRRPVGVGSMATLPTPVPALSGIVQIASGVYHFLALGSGGAVYGWGFNQLGQLGSGTGGTLPAPAPIANLTSVAALDGGLSHTLAVRTDGTAWSFGRNLFGQLGGGTADETSSFRTRVADLQADATAAAGGYGFSLFLRSNGTVWACGINTDGQFGNNDSSIDESPTPVQAATLKGTTPSTKAVTIKAGYGHALALAQSGVVWAWGSNGFGQVGNNSSATRILAPAQVAGLTGVVAISAGYQHSLAVKADGSVWAWGSNAQRQLGTTAVGMSRIPLQVAGISGAVAVAGGGAHSLALTSDGSVWAWGEGILGDVTEVPSTATPVQVQGISTATAIAAGLFHSYALLDSGQVVAWGSNENGQLGDGTLQFSRAPVRVATPSTVVRIASGGAHGLAILSDGTAMAWGENAFGQLGIGSEAYSVSPIQVTH